MLTIHESNFVGDKVNSGRMTDVDQDATILEACKLMRQTGLTELVVTAEAGGTLVSLGILTANDIVTRVIAAELDPAVLTAGDIALSESTSVDTAVYDAENDRQYQ